MEQFSLSLDPIQKLYTVAELNAQIRSLLQNELGLVSVTGEISGVRFAASGHYYFTLKDGESQLKSVCYRMTARYLKFKPQDGVLVVARGRIDVYEQRGEYQLLVDMLEPLGHGALQFAFEQLKKKLAAEGMFDSARKRALPKLPMRIGIVTSPDGAVIRDMLNVLERRFRGLHIRVFPAQMQGEGSIEQVCRGIRWFSESGWAQVVIVARGGGSLEDLWTFNEEQVARAIHDSAVPVVSAVGHETDFTIADFVADLRAPTPSAAAELIVCTREQLLDQVQGCEKTLVQLLRYRLSVLTRRLHAQGIERATTMLHRAMGRQFQRLDDIDRCLRANAGRNLKNQRENLHALDSRLRRMDLQLRFSTAQRRLAGLDNDTRQAMQLRLTQSRARFDLLAARLKSLSPLNVLERGYAIVQTAAGSVVKETSEAPPGSDIQIRLASGKLRAKVIQVDSSGLPS
ncbi:MAG: exodeoxyribonuclease VII large subunit [Bryobacteraceae bacterium]